LPQAGSGRRIKDQTQDIIAPALQLGQMCFQTFCVSDVWNVCATTLFSGGYRNP
jgi:hypothetical protein